MKRDSYKSFSSKVADSNSPYKPLRVVPKDSPLTPWKAKAREDGLQPANVVSKDTPLVALGKDGKPLDGSGEIDYAILKPEVEERLYSEVIAKALIKPQVLSTQFQDDASPDAFNNTIILNVPSIDPSGKPVAVTFGKIKAYLMMLKKLAADPDIMATFSNRVKSKMSLSRRPQQKLKSYNSKTTFAVSNTESIREIVHSDNEVNINESSSNYKYPIPKRCCEKTPARNPDWYYGFYTDTYVLIEGTSNNIYQPRGRIIFGPKEGCHAELPIFLPQVGNEICYRIATRIELKEPSSDRDDWNNPDNWNEQDAEDYETHMRNLVDQGYDRDWLDLVIPHPSLIIGSDASKAASGILFVWNESIWRCCWTDMPFNVGHHGHPYRGFNNDIFDDITIEAELRSSKWSEPPGWGGSHIYSGWGGIHIYLGTFQTPLGTPVSDDTYFELDGQKTWAPPSNSIDKVNVRLNNEFILKNDFSPPFGLTPNSELNLKADILRYRRMNLKPESIYSYTVFPFMAAVNPLILTAVDKLGQAWNPVYGSTWDKDSNGEWLDGHTNWCSESFNYFFRQQNWFDDIPGGGRNIGIGEMKDWFWEKGRYISGNSIPLDSDLRVKWEDLGDISRGFVLPGYFVSFRHGHHAGIFMYWTFPPMQPDRPDEGYSLEDLKEVYNCWNTDPLSELEINSDRKNQASTFDPTKTLNSFRVVNGNNSGRVRVETFTIARCKSRAESRFWLDFPSRPEVVVNPNPFSTKRGFTKSSIVKSVAKGKSGNTMVLWRDYEDEDLDQDGFGQTYGEPIMESKDNDN